MNNILLQTDVYKMGHMEQYAPGCNKVYSYLTARNDKNFDETVFFGLQYYIKKYLSAPITLEMGEEFLTYRKMILGSNSKEIKAPRISIYNDNGIVAKIGIDDRKVLTYELSVPLKYFGLNTSSPKEIAYEIALNDSSALWGGNAPPPLTIQGNPRGLGGMDIRLMDSRMSFWALYILTK